MPDTLDDVRSQLQVLGAIKLSWALERQFEAGHVRWICSVQAANEMGAPVTLPPEVGEALEQIVHKGQLGTLEPGVWLMDLQAGHISGPEPRPGDGASAPGIAERMP